MIAFLRAEPGGDVVRKALLAPTSKCFAHAINFSEVYYDSLRLAGQQEADRWVTDLLRVGIAYRADMTLQFMRSVATLKANRKRISLADCCGLTLAQELNGEFFTADRHELESLAAKGDYRIRFIR